MKSIKLQSHWLPPLFPQSLDATSLASRVLAHPFSKKAPAHVVAGGRVINHS